VTKNLIIGSLVVLFGLIGGAQSQQPGVTVIGSVTPGHCTSFASTLQLQDAGAACGNSGVSVTSVFGRMGGVVAQPNDYTLTQIAPGTVAATGGTIASTAITGGTIDGTVIGGTTRAAGSFTSVAITTPLPVTSGGTGDSGTAWTTFTPSPSCGTATFTVAVARFKTIGKTVFVMSEIGISTLGTCANVLSYTLPLTPNNSVAMAGWISNANMTGACTSVGSITVSCLKTGGINYVSSDTLFVSGVYESQ
jgi:hypothetical protein